MGPAGVRGSLRPLIAPSARDPQLCVQLAAAPVPPVATIGGGAYFLRRREGGESLGEGVTRPGANVGWGVEYYLRTFAIKSEMNVHILSNDRDFAELDGATLSAFTWTFGLKVPF